MKTIFVVLTFLLFELSYSQNYSSEKFDVLENEIIENGKTKFNTIISKDCNLKFNKEKQSYLFDCFNEDGSKVYYPFSIIKKGEKETLVRIPIKEEMQLYIVKDSIVFKNKIEFISKSMTVEDEKYQVIFRFKNLFN